MSLSTLLVQREITTIRDVEEALARQVLYGGDLVTNLLECASVDEAKLSDALGETMGLRPAGAGTLPPSAENARAFVSREVAEERNLVPLALTEDGEQLVIAVAEPLSGDDDERLMFLLGIPTVQRVAPLVRIREAMARDYGVALDQRSDRLLRRLRGERVESMSPPGVRPKVRGASQAPTESAAPPTIVDARPGPVPRATIASFPAPQQLDAVRGLVTPTPERVVPSHRLVREGSTGARPSRRRRGPLTFDAAKRELDGVDDRDGLIDLFFDFSRQYFDYAALFLVHGDIAEGRDAYGSGAARDRVAAIGVPLDLPSTLSVAKERTVAVVATPAVDGIDAMFTTDLGRPRKGEIIVVPLVVRRRTVALLYGDSNDTGAPIENPSDVTIFALLVGQTFERMIVKKKHGSSDRAMPRVVHVPAREAASEDRTQRALALSRAIHDVAPPPPFSEASSAPSIAPEVPSDVFSPAALSVPPPGETPAGTTTGSAPPPPNVLAVRRPSGPPIPRDDPADPTTRAPEQVFSAPRGPSQNPGATRSKPPIPREEPGAPPSASGRARRSERPRPDFREEPKTDPTMPAISMPPEESAHEVAVPGEGPPTLASPVGSSEAPSPAVTDPRDADTEADADLGGPHAGPSPARMEAEELTPHAARKLLAELEGERLEDRAGDSAPPSAIPPSQMIAVAPRRPPTSRTDTEDLPTIMVDVSAELEVLVRDIAAGKKEDRAEEELLRQGASAMPAILASFPGPTRNEPTADQEAYPPFSSCGPVLRLVASQRKVALPYVLPLVVDVHEERRFWGTFSLTELAYPEATPVLIPRLFDESARIRRVARLAVAAIARVHGEHVARELGRFARDSQNERRRRLDVIRLLEDVREPMAVPTFIALIDDADREIGDSALRALEVVARQELGGDPKKWKSWWNTHSSRHRIEWLIDALMHESQTVRRSASDELKAITKEYFGYYPDETKRDREKAQARYREWWSTEGRLKFVVT